VSRHLHQPTSTSTSIKNKLEVEVLKTKITRCKECGKEFASPIRDLKRGRGLLCSLSCSAKYGNKKRKPTGVKQICSTCGKTIYRTRTRVNRNKTKRFYCNRECKRKAELNGNQKRKHFGSQRKRHLERKQELLNKIGVRCQYPSCELELFNDRKLIDIHHFAENLDHSKTVLLCPYHHRLADKGYINQEIISSL
jgi:hypothetical protein